VDFSIIVPTYNRPRQLGDCLGALARLDYARDRFEVVVVDDGGTTPLEGVTAGFRVQLDLTLLATANAGPAAARNLGAGRARGRYLAFTDDDCRAAPGWLRALGARASAVPGAMLGGRTLNALPGNLCSTLSQTVIEVAYAHYNADPDNARFFAANNLAVPADRFRALGGFDPAFGTAEDRDLCDRWLSDGGRLVYAPDAVVHHAHALTLARLWRQHFAYGRGAHRFHRTRKRYGRKSFKIDPAFYRALLLHPYSREGLPRAVALTGLLAAQQVANATGFLAEMLNHSRSAS
jgi:GT2 family glycosyltransferase